MAVRKNKVNMFDPNNLGENGTLFNIEDLNIFVELTAQRKGSTKLFISDTGSSVKTDSDTYTINMMGFNKETNYHTTEWTNNVINNPKIQYEGFGITNIKIVTNSSFLPQVTIEFIDIHGLNFFNNDKASPYKVLFDFPPPIFKLTIKGYYGVALEYDLHLINTQVKFNTDTGNYHIHSNFVARTFAPLSDVLFKYVEYFPLLGENNITDSVPNVEPRNTHELIYKLKNLYDEIGKTTNNSKYNSEMDSNRILISNIDSLLQMFNYYQNNFIVENAAENVIMVKFRPVQDGENDYTLTPTTYLEYYKYLNKLGLTSYSPKSIESLRIGFIASNNESILELNAFRKKLLDKAKSIGIISDYSDEISIDSNDNIYGIQTLKYNDKDYNFIDVTNLLHRTSLKLNKAINNYNLNYQQFTEEIDRLPLENLGFQPNIYNIFKILCDDIDTFFNVFKKYYDDAITHHEKYYNSIINNGNEGVTNKNDKIIPFPLCYDKNGNDIVNGRKAKIIPTRLSDSLDEPFPEVKLVDEFLNKYVDVIKEDMVDNIRNKLDNRNINLWIPISPIDSEIYPESNNPESPYKNTTELATRNESVINSILATLLKRYYVLSYYVLPNIFQDGTIKEYGSAIEYFATAEAANIANSLINKETLYNLEVFSKSDLETFYGTLNTIRIYNELSLSENQILNINNTDVYVAKTDSNFIGTSFILETEISEVEPTNENTDPISNFVNSYNEKNTWIKKLFKGSRDIDTLTKENLLYIKNDNSLKLNNNTNIDINRYFYNHKVGDKSSIYDDLKTGTYGTYYTFLYSMIKIYKDEIKTLLEYNPNSSFDKIFALLLGSGFGRVATPYDRNANGELEDFRKLRDYMQLPSLTSVPFGFILYIGGLVAMKRDSTMYDRLTDLMSFVSVGDGTNIYRYGLLNDDVYEKISKNVDDVDNYLAESDKEKYFQMFNNFVVNNSNTEFSDSYTPFITSIKELINHENNDTDTEKANRIVNSDAFNIINKKTGLLIHSSKAYSIDNLSNDEYVPLGIKDNKTNDDYFFKTFLNKLNSYVNERIDEINKIDTTYLGRVNNNDIRTRIYYSFKNIADKWFSVENKNKKRPSAYPTINNKLIDNFMFVDRAMNDIGGSRGSGVIIDVKNLIDASNDLDMNMLSLFSLILSHNNFEFFPLQNFMTFNGSEWNEKAFKPTSNLELDVALNPAFICVNVGGFSSILSDPTGYLPDDGMVSLENAGDDFMGDADIEDVKTNVNAFKVAFGAQNQSIFIGVDVDTNEYPETNESLKILSSIADGDSDASPEPMSQNLFNMYQKRSYSTTVSMLGNVMLQPTQYYEITNIPMFNGSYEVLNVEHDITPNHMITKFNGVKIANHPDPLVTNFSTSIGIGGGNSNLIVNNIPDSSSNTRNYVFTDTPPDPLNINDLFTYTI